MPLNIRPAVREDATLILRFITDLAIYENLWSPPFLQY